MKYQCTVCGQIIDRDDVCPICGSDSSKIISLGEDTQESVTFRCLSCGRVFEDKDVCPYCGGEELYDLTHDNLFNRNKNKNKNVDSSSVTSNNQEESFSDDFDLLGEFTKSAKGQNNEEVFEEKEIILEKEEPEIVDDSTVIKDDPFLNTEINVEEIKEENVEEPVQVEETKEEREEELIEPSLEEEIEVDDEFKKDLLSKKEEINETSLDLKVRRIDLTKDLIIKLFLELEEDGNEEKEKFLKEELGILSKLSSEFDSKTVSSILEEKDELNKEIFDNEKDPFNGYVLYLESTKKDLK